MKSLDKLEGALIGKRIVPVSQNHIDDLRQKGFRKVEEHLSSRGNFDDEGRYTRTQTGGLDWMKADYEEQIWKRPISAEHDEVIIVVSPIRMSASSSLPTNPNYQGPRTFVVSTPSEEGSNHTPHNPR